ncbi:MAG TPA: hypothetical protein ENK41_00575 [Rhodobacteraceae bacterium]|nr:hypothetical protein [Paracoccaceae bacterium]
MNRTGWRACGKSPSRNCEPGPSPIERAASRDPDHREDSIRTPGKNGAEKGSRQPEKKKHAASL